MSEQPGDWDVALGVAGVLADNAVYLRDLVQDLRRGRGGEQVRVAEEVLRVLSAIRWRAHGLRALCAEAGVVDRQDREDILVEALARAAAQLHSDPPGNAHRALATIEDVLRQPWAAARETALARLCRVVEDALCIAEAEGHDMAMEPWCSLAEAVHGARGG